MNEEVSAKRFSVSETVFAWFCLVCCYLYCRVFPATANPAGGAAVLFAMYIAVFVMLGIKHKKLNKKALLSAASGLAVLASLIVSADALLRFFAFCYSLASLFYFIYSAWDNNLESRQSNLFFIEYFKALIIMPFASFGAALMKRLFPCDVKGKKTALSVILGIALAIIPTAVVIALLSYDADFEYTINNLFDFSFEDFISQFFSIAFAFPMAMYVFGSYHSSNTKKCGSVITKAGCYKAGMIIKGLSPLTALFAVIPILAVYVIFFVSQFKYYVAGFSGILPENFSYADYAKNGFSELCIVAAVNLTVIIVMSVFTKDVNGKHHPVVRVLSVIISVFTFVLMSTAFSKLALYIQHFGLTQLRVYSAWFMFVLFVIFALIIVKQIKTDFRLISSSAIAAILLFAVLSLSGVNGIIAEYNTDRYFDKSLSGIDVETIAELGDEGVPSLVRLAKYYDGKYGVSINEYAEYLNNGMKLSSEEKEKYSEFEKKSKEDFSVYVKLAEKLSSAASHFETEFKTLNAPHIKAGKELQSVGFKLETDAED